MDGAVFFAWRNRKAALGNNPVDCFNRRGFAAAKRFRPEGYFVRVITDIFCNGITDSGIEAVAL